MEGRIKVLSRMETVIGERLLECCGGLIDKSRITLIEFQGQPNKIYQVDGKPVLEIIDGGVTFEGMTMKHSFQWRNIN